MAIRLNNGTIFLHIPKTGGEWVKRVLQKQRIVKLRFPGSHPNMERVLNCPRYFTKLYLEQMLRERNPHVYKDIRRCFKFCFVRNPFSWYESYWRYMCGLDWKVDHQFEGRATLRSPWFPNLILRRFGSSDFDTFMRNVIEHYPGYLTQMYGWYAVPGEIDFVGRTERLVDDLVHVLEKTGADVDASAIRKVGRVNESPETVERPTWDEEIKREIYRLEYPIFKQYGYSAPDGTT